eukprot:4191165-Pyramimonas_sp.AAC.1
MVTMTVAAEDSEAKACCITGFHFQQAPAGCITQLVPKRMVFPGAYCSMRKTIVQKESQKAMLAAGPVSGGQGNVTVIESSVIVDGTQANPKDSAGEAADEVMKDRDAEAEVLEGVVDDKAAGLLEAKSREDGCGVLAVKDDPEGLIQGRTVTVFTDFSAASLPADRVMTITVNAETMSSALSMDL